MKRFVLPLICFCLLAMAAHPGRGGQGRHAAGGDTLRYLFVGHGYNWQPGYNRIDPRVTGLDWSRFDKKIFGGDLNSEALKYERYVQFMDSAFDLRSLNTMYVLGNHDARNENFEYYHHYTGRRTYYAYTDHHAVFMVINTTLNAGNCEDLDAQYDMIKNVCDTITSATSHLFIFQHHNLWIGVPGLPNNPHVYSNWQIPYWDANCSGDTATFAAAIYPMLKAVKDKGVEVVSVLGDCGVTNKGAYLYSSDSLVFLSSGINNSKWANDSVALAAQPKDKVLVIEHIPAERHASYHFLDLDSLFEAHQ
jgi:hypothetical protein